jgi:hypothetical protein
MSMKQMKVNSLCFYSLIQNIKVVAFNLSAVNWRQTDTITQSSNKQGIM